MSLITSCPACGTMFRVVPDQLKISEGWVRCGHCGEIFDAAAALAEQPEVPAVNGPRTLSAPAGAAAVPAPDPSGPVGAPWAADVPPAVAKPEPPAPAPSAAPESATALGPPPVIEPQPEPPEPPAAPAAPAAPYRPAVGNPAPPARTPAEPMAADSELLEESPKDLPFIFRRSDLARDAADGTDGIDESDVVPDPRPQVLETAAPGSPPESESEASGLEQVSFVRQARQRAFWRRPLVRLALGALAAVLALLLTVQVAYQERDRLASAQPALTPWLEQLCEVAGCRVSALRAIESVVIESSTFSKLRSDVYRLSFTLRNTSTLGIAVPAMELTLTDGQDQAVLRRVLTPEEMGAKAPLLAPGADLALSVGVAVAPAANGRVAGYRLLAFYP